MITPGQGLPDKPWQDVGDPTAQYVRVPCDALTDLERKREQFQYRDRIYRVIAHDFLRDVYGAELISGGNGPARPVNEQLVNTVRKQLRIHLADDPYAEKIALATAAAIEEHRGEAAISSPSPTITPLLEGAQILRLEPGDTIVLRSPHLLSDQEIDLLSSQMANQFPGHQIAVLERGMELTILRPEGAAGDD